MKRIFLLLICISFLCKAQPSETVTADSSGKGISSTNKILIYTGSAIVITAILFKTDQKTYDNLYDWKTHNKAVNKISPVITYLGDGTINLGIYGGFLGYGFIFDDRKALEVAKIGVESYFLTGAAVQIIKHLTGRERPSASTRPGGFWHGPFAFFRQPQGVSKGIPSFDAFPSGHTATVFSTATTISDFYTESWVSYTCYSLATLTAISRITESTHWLSDCFIGAIIGHYGTRLVEKLNYGDEGISVSAKSNDYGYEVVVLKPEVLTIKYTMKFFPYLLPTLLALSISITGVCHAQTLYDTGISDTIPFTGKKSVEDVEWYTMFANIPRDWGRWYDISFRKERVNEWMIIGGLTLATVLTDDITYTPAEKFYKGSPDAKKWSDFCANIGDGTTQFALAGGFGAYGLIFKDKKSQRVGSQIVQAVLASGAIIQVLKHVTGRESPFVRSTPTGTWKILPNQIDYHRRVPYFDAYPSGHICTSLATVIVIAENYPDVKWIRPAGYTFTALVGLGMLSNGIHWISDYPLGLFIGYYFGMLAAHPEGLPVSGGDDKGVKVQILPHITPAGTGARLTMTF